MRSKTSEVDELLFGGPNKDKQPRSANRKPEVLQVITKDLIRNVIVPQEKADRTILLEKSMAQHIEEKSSVKSKETIRAEMDMARKEKNDAITAAAQRKERFKEIDIHRKKSQALNEIDLEAKRINEHLLENAKAKRLEQEDEIKHLNELILNAKCHAIRDAQILERDIIQKEEMEDEARCDRISEVHRLNCIQDAENKKALMTAKRIEGAQQIMDQIRRNEEARILEEERKNAEQAALNRYIAKLKQEDLDKLREKREYQDGIKKDIDILNQQAEIVKERKIQEEKELAKKINAFVEQRDAREAALKSEKEYIRKFKEEKQMRLLRLQESQNDHKAEQDAIRAKHEREAADREWRAKELEKKKKNEETVEMLKQARRQQIATREHYQAVQAQRERDEFQRILKNQTLKAQAEKEEDQARHESNLRHADEIRKQIRDREQERIQKRREYFEEANRKMAAEIEHRNKLRELKVKKLEDLRRAGVPDKYTAEVARRVLDDSQKPLQPLHKKGR